MIEIALYQPEIPPNTGNVIRLAANLGARLHLIRPLGFALDEKAVRRAGMDYRELACVEQHRDWAAFADAVGPDRLVALSSHASHLYSDYAFTGGEVLLFGPETRGLPAELMDQIPSRRRLTIPMREGSRSLNLSNAVAVVAYEAWRQLGYKVE